MVIAQAAALPSVEAGLFLGLMKRSLGGYLSFRSSYGGIKEDYTCSSYGRTDFGYIWASGKVRYSRFSVSGGILAGISGGLAFYAGAGYRRSDRLWEDTSGKWARVEDLSRCGVIAEAGAIWRFNRLTLMAGLSSISFCTISPVAGVGVRF